MKNTKLLVLLILIFIPLILLISCDENEEISCDHEYETTSLGADCEHGVTNTKICTKCGDRSDTYSPPLGHTFYKSTVPATCSESGYTLYSCDCGFTYKADIVAANGHYYKETVTSPTCDTAGYTTYTCRNCAYTYIANEVSPTEHDFECNMIDPTCLDRGYAKYSCKNCDMSFISDYCDPKGHKFTSSVTLPGCDDQGYTTYTCNSCTYSFVSDFTQPKGHEFSCEITLPGCETSGHSTYVCNNCSHSYISDFVDPVGHDFSEITVTKPNCTSVGETRYTCDCGYFYSEIVAPTGHDFKISVVNPTVSDMGYTSFSCDCGFNYVGNYRFYSEILDNAYAGNDQVLAQGIDISKWNHTVNTKGEFEPLDWVALKESGVDYVILKIGSTPREDGRLGGIEPTFEMDYEGAKAAGIDVGVYYFTYAESVSDIRKDAETILSWLDGKQFEYPIYLDLEDSANEDYFPSKIASPILTEMCLTFFSELQKEGYYTGLYVNNEFLYNILQTDNMIDLFEIWYARYPSNTPTIWDPDDKESFVWNTEKYGDHLGMWQYTCYGSLSPITTDVDFNYSYKDYPTLIKTHGFNGFGSVDEPVEDKSDGESDTEINEETEYGFVIDEIS